MSSKKLSVLYWVLTAFVAIVMGVAGVLCLFHLDGALKAIHEHLGYPVYFATILGLGRLLGTAAIVLPVPQGLRDWAYAGFSFDLTVTIVSILLGGIQALAIVQPLIVLVAVLGSYVCWRRRCAQPVPTDSLPNQERV